MVEEIVPPTGLVKSAVKVTHNNDRKHYVIAIDDAKEGAAIWNLDPFFKARVGDSNATLSVVWYHQGRLRNFNNVEEAKPFISGNVGNYSIDSNNQIKLDPGTAPVDFTGSTEDVGDGGRVDYHFPDAMFPQSGIFKGFIGIQDKQGRVSGVTIWFRVLDGIARMGTAKQVYINDLEKLELEAQQNLRAKLADFDQAVQKMTAQFSEDTDSLKQQMTADFNKSLADHEKNFDDEMKEINDKLDFANQLAKGIANANNTLSEAVDANSEAVRNGLAPVMNKSNVFEASNTFSESTIFNGGLVAEGKVLINGTDLAEMISDLNDLKVAVKKLQGGVN